VSAKHAHELIVLDVPQPVAEVRLAQEAKVGQQLAETNVR
jgi:hypothetical protein